MKSKQKIIAVLVLLITLIVLVLMFLERIVVLSPNSGELKTELRFFGLIISSSTVYNFNVNINTNYPSLILRQYYIGRKTFGGAVNETHEYTVVDEFTTEEKILYDQGMITTVSQKKFITDLNTEFLTAICKQDLDAAYAANSKLVVGINKNEPTRQP